jgi:phospholipid/cholesterol/gamma-HCH transport system substrate-binding protein
MSRLLKIGLFVAITGTLSVFYIMQTVEAIDAEETVLINAYLDDASGLLPDSRVRLSGVDVGRVKSIVLEDGRAKVTMEIDARITMYQDSRVIKKMDSLLGNSVITLDPGSMSSGTIPENGVVRIVESETVMNRAFATTERVAAELELLLSEYREFMNSGGYSQIEEILAAAQRSVDVSGDLVEQNLLLMREAMGDIADVAERVNLQSDRETENISAILEHTAQLTGRLDRMLAENDRELNLALVEMRRSAEKLTAVLESTRGVTEKIERGEGNLGRLIYDDELYERVVRMSEDVEGYIDSTIGMDVQLGFQANYLSGASGVENRAEVRLIPGGTGKDYRLGVTIPPGSESPAGSGDMFISAQLARTYGIMTLRGGLIESSGGLGIDLQPLRQVEVSSQMYRLGRDSGPSLDAVGTLYPFFDPASDNPLRWLYISGGVRDALVDAQRDYHLGIGLRLYDNDLKGIIQYVPSP